jgi:hypothetical protein
MALISFSIKLIKSMRKSTNILLISLIFLSGIFSQHEALARELSWSDSKCGLSTNDSVVTYDPLYNNRTSPTWNSAFKDTETTGLISLKLDESQTAWYYNSRVQFDVAITIKAFKADSSYHLLYDTLSVTYDPATGQKHTDISVIKLQGYYRISATVDSIISTPNVSYAGNLCMEVSLTINRYYAFDPNDNNSYTTLSDTFYSDKTELKVSWPPIESAEEYELEWIFVSDVESVHEDDTIIINYIDSTNLIFNFDHNATRVSLYEPEYNIPLAYEHGYILYRVRAIGVDTADINVRLEGKWGDHAFSGSFISDYNNFYLCTGHEQHLNWQYSIGFAEEGKRKFAISYFDGSNRNRQQLTKITSLDTTIVQETYYDFVGRAAMQTLPVPSFSAAITYYDSFHFDTTGDAYDRNDLITSCNMQSPYKMDSIRGASRYYSSYHPDKNGINAYIPDAGGYPFIQTEFTPDLTGRIRKQGALGADHHIGSGHETKYYYSTVDNQAKLNAMFGVEVGFKEHYKKNMVVDPNGQVAISYLDAKGNVIATALGGEAPDSMQALSSNQQLQWEIDPLADSISGNDTSVYLFSTFTVSTASTYTFDYNLVGEVYKYLVDEADSFCMSCVYDLYISLTDECEEEQFNSGAGPVKLTIHNTDTSSCDTFSYMMTTQNLSLEVGEYTLSYILSINEDSLDYYEDIFLVNNTNLLSWEDFLRPIDSTDCVTITDSVDMNVCDLILQILKMDVSPYGQYLEMDSIDVDGNVLDTMSFLNTDNSFSFNTSYQDIFYTDYNGDTSMVEIAGVDYLPSELSPIQFVQNFVNSWADSLVYYHPEYCEYEYCVSMLAIYEYDENMLNTDSFQHAFDSGFFKPWNYPDTSEMPSFIRTSNSTADNTWTLSGVDSQFMYSYMGMDTSLWDYAYMLSQDQLDVYDSLKCVGFIDGLQNDSLELYWQTYRGLYHSITGLIMDQLRDSFTCQPNDKAFNSGGTTYWEDNGKEIRIKALDEYLDLTFSLTNDTINWTAADSVEARVNARLDTMAQYACQYLSMKWEDDLYDCLSLIPDDSSHLIDQLMIAFTDICEKGFSIADPFGTIDISPDTITGGYSNFDEALSGILGDLCNDTFCNSLYIDFPYYAGHSYFP